MNRQIHLCFLNLAQQHRCSLKVKCEYCNTFFQKFQQQEHDDGCTARQVKLLHFVCPSIEVRVPSFSFLVLKFQEAAFADMLAQLSGNFDKTMEQVLSMFQPLNTMIEFFNMTKGVREYHLIQLISVCISESIYFRNYLCLQTDGFRLNVDFKSRKICFNGLKATALGLFCD